MRRDDFRVDAQAHAVALRERALQNGVGALLGALTLIEDRNIDRAAAADLEVFALFLAEIDIGAGLQHVEKRAATILRGSLDREISRDDIGASLERRLEQGVARRDRRRVEGERQREEFDGADIRSYEI